MKVSKCVSVDGATGNGRYQLSDEDRRKSVSPEARARRRATLAERRAQRAEVARWLRRERRMVPEAIADYLGITDGQVRVYLREAGQPRGSVCKRG